MHYFIDGYNLLFRLSLFDKEDLQSQRQAIILDLNQKISLLKLDVSIVFDAAFQEGVGSRGHYNAIEILFTGEGETADQYILEEIKNHPHPAQETVVTSDKTLARLARNQSARTVSTEEFMPWLNRCYKNKLRGLKKDKGQKPVEPAAPLHQKPAPSEKTPPKSAPLESCEEFYLQAFESQWQEILKEEELHKKTPPPNAKIKKHPRSQKIKPDPFESEQEAEERQACEMDRWLKIFEKRPK